MATLTELEDALVNADAAGASEDARAIADEIVRLRQETEAQTATRATPLILADRTPEAVSTVTGMTDRQAQQRAETGMAEFRKVAAPAVRYGLPVAASLAAAPFTGGMSLLGGAAAMSSVGAVSSGAGEFLAQNIEGDTVDPKRVASAAAYGLTPVRGAGSILQRAAFNIPSALAANELGRFIEAGGVDAYKQSLDDDSKLARWGLPAGLAATFSAIGGHGQKATASEKLRSEISASRGGGAVMLSEVDPRFTAKEAAAIARGNRLAIKTLDGIEANVGDMILSAYPDVPNTSPLAESLGATKARLEALQAQYANAAAEAKRLAAEAADAKGKGLLTAGNRLEEAKQSAFEAMQAKHIFESDAAQAFGANANFSELAAGKRADRVVAMANAAKKISGDGLKGMYEAAGIGLNDTVATYGDLVASMESHGGKLLKGELARRELASAIDDVFLDLHPDLKAAKLAAGQGHGFRIPDEAPVTLEAYRSFKDRIASKLAAVNNDPIKAERLAAEKYSVIKDAADGFMARTAPDRLAMWTAAQEAAAKRFAAGRKLVDGSPSAIDRLSSGDIDGLLADIKHNGAGSAWRSIDEYRAVIANSYNRANPEAKGLAKQAADAFVRDVDLALRDSVLDSAIAGQRGTGSYGINSEGLRKLASEVQALRTKGFPIERLGLGKPEAIEAFAKASSTARTAGLTKEGLSEFLDLLPRIGADKAAAMVDYRQGVKEFVLAAGGKLEAKKRAAMMASARRAGIDADTAQSELNRAMQDPLVGFFQSKGSAMRLPQDPIEAAGWVKSLITGSTDHELVADMMKALRDSGRTADADGIGRAAAVEILRNFEPVADSGGSHANLRRIADFFYGNNPDAQRKLAVFKALVGPDEFKAINENIVSPVRKIVDTNLALQSDREARGLMAAARFRAGNIGQVQTYGTLENIANLIRDGRYRQLHLLYADPKWSRRFAAVGGSMEKFTKDPANRVALLFAANEDAENATTR